MESIPPSPLKSHFLGSPGHFKEQYFSVGKMKSDTFPCGPHKIGEQAGKIWRLIDSQGQVDMSSIVKKTQIKIQDAYSALGWLAREDKIKTNCKNKQIKFQLK